MGTPCNPTLAAPYAPKHVPFLYYSDIYSNSTRCAQRIRDYGDFAADIAAGTYRFSLISPNLCDDMHGDPSCPSSPSSIAQGDAWLAQEVPKILATPGFGASGKDVLFIVWDEQTGQHRGRVDPDAAHRDLAAREEGPHEHGVHPRVAPCDDRRHLRCFPPRRRGDGLSDHRRLEVRRGR